jgi:hypothetical protein
MGIAVDEILRRLNAPNDPEKRLYLRLAILSMELLCLAAAVYMTATLYQYHNGWTGAMASVNRTCGFNSIYDWNQLNSSIGR